MSRFHFYPPGLVFVVIVFSTIFFLPFSILAADLKLGATYPSYQVGDNVKVVILLSSPKESANAASAVVSFPTDKLTLTGLSREGSILNMWVRDPNYSNSLGQVTFEGVVLNKGYTGSAGNLLTVMFKAKSAGTATLSFKEGSILANDGQGTSILNKLGQLSITITPRVEPVVVPKPTIAATTTPKENIIPSPVVATTSPSVATSVPEQLFIEESQPTISNEIVAEAPKSFVASILNLTNLLILLMSLVIVLAGLLIMILLRGKSRRIVSVSNSVATTTSSNQSLAPAVYNGGCGVIFRGHSNPVNTVVLLRDGQVITKLRVSPDSSFEIILTGLIPGNYNFDLASVDAVGRQSVIQNFPILLSAGVILPINGIFTNPTT